MRTVILLFLFTLAMAFQSCEIGEEDLENDTETVMTADNEMSRARNNLNTQEGEVE